VLIFCLKLEIVFPPSFGLRFDIGAVRLLPKHESGIPGTLSRYAKPPLPTSSTHSFELPRGACVNPTETLIIKMPVAPIKKIETSWRPLEPDNDPNKIWRKSCAFGLPTRGNPSGGSYCRWHYTLKDPKDQLKSF
jgi:hypothetical protein